MTLDAIFGNARLDKKETRKQLVWELNLRCLTPQQQLSQTLGMILWGGFFFAFHATGFGRTNSHTLVHDYKPKPTSHFTSTVSVLPPVRQYISMTLQPPGYLQLASTIAKMPL